MFHDQWFRCDNNMENIDYCETYGNNSPSSSSISGESTISNASSSSSSLETMDDASSSPTSCSNLSSHGALYDLSTLMAHLPIKRGLSKYYEGKSQNYTSLAGVTSLEDLPKKETPTYCRKKCKSYGGLYSYKSYTLNPKPTLLKKASRTSFVSSCFTKKTNSSIRSRSRPPLIPGQTT